MIPKVRNGFFDGQIDAPEIISIRQAFKERDFVRVETVDYNRICEGEIDGKGDVEFIRRYGRVPSAAGLLYRRIALLVEEPKDVDEDLGRDFRIPLRDFDVF